MSMADTPFTPPWLLDDASPATPTSPALKQVSATLKAAGRSRRISVKSQAIERETEAILTTLAEVGPVSVDVIVPKRVLDRLANPTPEEQADMDLFVKEYMYDFHQMRAALRCGQPHDKASQWASRMLQHPYVQQRMRKFIEEMDAATAVSHSRILMGLVREAERTGDNSSHAARVAGWAHLAKITGMAIDKSETKVEFKGGVMMVPATSSLDDWEASTAAQQDKLKTDVRV